MVGLEDWIVSFWGPCIFSDTLGVTTITTWKPRLLNQCIFTKDPFSFPAAWGKKHIWHTRWAPTSYKLSYNPYKWFVKWVTGVITLLIGVISPFKTSGGGPPCRSVNIFGGKCFFWTTVCFFRVPGETIHTIHHIFCKPATAISILFHTFPENKISISTKPFWHIYIYE